MDVQLFLQWLPGILMVAVPSFPAFFFIERGFLIRLAVACISSGCFLFLFAAVIGHQFSFTRREDVPVLALGLTLAWFLSASTRALRSTLSQRHTS